MPGAVLILLVVLLWLGVLAPLLLRNQGPVRRTSKALQETRVLFEGGSGSLKSRVRHPIPVPNDDVRDEPQEEYRLLDEGDASMDEAEIPTGDPVAADEPELVDAELVDDEFSQSVPTEPSSDTHATDRPSVAGPVVDDAARVSPAIIDGDIVMSAPESVDTDDASVKAENASDVDTDGVSDADDDADSEASDATDDDVVENTNVVPLRPIVADLDDEEFELSLSGEQRLRYHDRENNPDAYLRPSDVMVRPELDPGFAQDHITTEAEPETDEDDQQPHRRISLTNLIEETFEPEVEFTEADRDFASSRRGRGYYDPEHAQQLAKQRCQRRQRVFFGSLAVLVALTVCAFVWGGAWWIGSVAALAFTALYLVNLRRQAIEEQRLAQRRLQRMRRARLGVANTADDELEVPQRLRRPMGVVIETIDDDPELSDLPYAPRDMVDDLYARFEGAAPTSPHRTA